MPHRRTLLSYCLSGKYLLGWFKEQISLDGKDHAGIEQAPAKNAQSFALLVQGGQEAKSSPCLLLFGYKYTCALQAHMAAPLSLFLLDKLCTGRDLKPLVLSPSHNVTRVQC